MAGVTGIGRPAAGAPGAAGAAGAARRPNGPGGFFVAPNSAAAGVGGAGAASAAAPTEAAASVSLGAMLALQESPGEPVRDRAARRHGEAMLRLLAALQRARLGGTGAETVLAELGALVAGIPAAADPGLRGVVSAVALRVRVELARQP